MRKVKGDKRADILEVADRGEPTTMMEPLLIGGDSRHRGPLLDLVLELVAKSASFRRSLPTGVRAALSNLVRSMNCYYSNLIEGHDTHPVDIERALRNDYSADPHKRDLQVEAKAHVVVQQWIDAGGLHSRAATVEGLGQIHSRFCASLPDDMRWIEDPKTHERLCLAPGELRLRDVRIGRHIPVSPGAVPRFLSRFEEIYARLGKTDSILATAAAHHRLLWIHPFLDGNGRVARLMSHAMLLGALDTGAIWSIARGLARNEAAYKGHLAECDLSRRNDLDGRGNLSEEALAAFTRFFLDTCIDQITFMEGLMQPERLRTRILLWAEEETRLNLLPPKAGAVLEAALYRGELRRGDVGELLGLTPRHARRIISELLTRGVLTSEGPRDLLLLGFPAALASRWMPGLFPERNSASS
jgi:Fic family protein